MLTFTFRSLLLTILVVLANSADADELKDRLLGPWRCMAAESEEAKDGTEEGDVWVFTEKQIRVRTAGGTVVIVEYTINAHNTPAEIDWTGTDEAGTKWIGRGIEMRPRELSDLRTDYAEGGGVCSSEGFCHQERGRIDADAAIQQD